MLSVRYVSRSLRAAFFRLEEIFCYECSFAACSTTESISEDQCVVHCCYHYVTLCRTVFAHRRWSRPELTVVLGDGFFSELCVYSVTFLASLPGSAWVGTMLKHYIGCNIAGGYGTFRRAREQGIITILSSSSSICREYASTTTEQRAHVHNTAMWRRCGECWWKHKSVFLFFFFSCFYSVSTIQFKH